MDFPARWLPSLASTNAVDWLLAAIVLLGAVGGWRRGFVAAALQLLTLAASLAIALAGYAQPARWLQERAPALGDWAPPLAFLGLFAFLYAALAMLAGRAIGRLPPKAHGHAVNRLLGIAPGLVNGLVNAMVVAVLLLTVPALDTVTRLARDSAFASRLSVPAQWLEAELEPIFERPIRRSLQTLTVPVESNESVPLPFRVAQPRVRPELEARMLAMVNEERTQRGLKPLQPDPELTQVARAHSRDMYPAPAVRPRRHRGARRRGARLDGDAELPELTGGEPNPTAERRGRRAYAEDARESKTDFSLVFLLRALRPSRPLRSAVGLLSVRVQNRRMSTPSSTPFADALATWNRRFGTDEYLFGTEPNAWLRGHAPLLQRGWRALSVADGEGRNSVWLAQQGLAVDAFDLSPVAIEKARRLAAGRGVAVNFAVSDVDGYPWPEAAYDAVAAIFVQFADPALRGRLFARIERSLKPGGLLFLQGYTPKQLEYKTGGPPQVEHLYTEAMLRQAFAGWEVLELREYEAVVEEGTGHKGMSALVGMVARRR